MTTVNARDITQTVRIERFRLSVVLVVVALISILLSLFLARTIVRPLRRLARAAVRVRLGRAREVVVPRLPSRARRDRACSRARCRDMSLALRARIDATEAFAADVTHELKNPLASLRSAVEGLDAGQGSGAAATQLLAIVRDDVHRLDRLITDISEASRLDAQLSRAKFEPVDLIALIDGLLDQRRERGVERGIRIALRSRPARDAAIGARRRRAAGAGVREPDRQRAVLLARRRDGRDRRDRRATASVVGPRRGRRAGRARPTRARRSSAASSRSGPKARRSASIPAWASPLRGPSSRRITARSRSNRARTALSGARFVVRLPLADGRCDDRVTGRPKRSTPPASRSTGARVLIEGPSGAGKSDLALRLIDRGAHAGQRRLTRCCVTRRHG